MARILGVLVGSAMAIAALIIMVGVPDLRSAVTQTTAPEIQQAARAPDRAVAENPPADPVDMAEAVATPEPSVPDDPPASVESVDAIAPAPEEDFGNKATLAETAAPPATEQRWYAFWSPFRSQLAANGFVTQLQRVTALDYRVVTVKPGVYEVAFAYAHVEEIDANLSEISAATGLDVPDS